MTLETFNCVVCGEAFTVPADALKRYPTWRPKHCRAHSPTKKDTKSGGRRKNSGSARRASSRAGEQNHTTQQVLEKFTEGPQDGVFTDGGCSPNPGRGGWGLVWVKGNDIVEQRHGYDADTTNNRMEMTAIIEALELLPEDSTDVIFTDSKLCVDTLMTWAAGWEKRGWKRKTGPIKNLELVQRGYALKQSRPGVKLQHIKAHVGYRWNEYADSLATAWMRDEV